MKKYVNIIKKSMGFINNIFSTKSFVDGAMAGFLAGDSGGKFGLNKGDKAFKGSNADFMAKGTQLTAPNDFLKSVSFGKVTAVGTPVLFSEKLGSHSIIELQDERTVITNNTVNTNVSSNIESNNININKTN